MERQLITRVLQQTSGNQVQAARILGITRGSLRTKIRALQITIEALHPDGRRHGRVAVSQTAVSILSIVHGVHPVPGM